MMICFWLQLFFIKKNVLTNTEVEVDDAIPVAAAVAVAVAWI